MDWQNQLTINNSSLILKVEFVFSKVIIYDITQLKDLLKRTVEEFVKLFDAEDQRGLPIFKMELTFDDDKMEFYPTFQDLEDVVLSLVERIAEALQVFLCPYPLSFFFFF